MPRTLIDSNIFLFGYMYEESNCSLILENIDGELITPVISTMILDEVRTRAKKLLGKDISSLIAFNMLTLPDVIVVQDDEIIPLLGTYSDLVSDNSDLPYVCAYFAKGCDHFLTANRKLTQQKIKDKVHFISPKRFVDDILSVKSYNTPNGI